MRLEFFGEELTRNSHRIANGRPIMRYLGIRAFGAQGVEGRCWPMAMRAP